MEAKEGESQHLISSFERGWENSSWSSTFSSDYSRVSWMKPGKWDWWNCNNNGLSDQFRYIGYMLLS